MFIGMLFSHPDLYFMLLIIVIFSICLHEYMHARVALWQGDPTAAHQGHLTLNPMIQMGPFSLIMCAIIGIAWGAVPINPGYLRHRNSEVLVAFAGPAANLGLFIFFSFLTACCFVFNLPSGAYLFCNYGAAINFVLFVFNMLPVPMLDGATIFSGLFPRLHHVNEELRNGLTWLIFIIFFFSSSQIYSLGFTMTRWLTGFFLMPFSFIH